MDTFLVISDAVTNYILILLQQPLSSTNFLYELDRVTTEIVQVIIAALKTFVPGDTISIPSSTDKVSFEILPFSGTIRYHF